MLGYSPLAFEDMALSQRERVFSHLPSLIMVGLPLLHSAGQRLILFRQIQQLAPDLLIRALCKAAKVSGTFQELGSIHYATTEMTNCRVA